ncbi:MAG: hypothetical protein SRB2_03917 [Desulfobacteraceae bacterium Eth-SRB2]|nr:MAG: hypothetical protein SRB2_03917 [Desulfobacteraceae bacterium Eth-SRB2]
MSVHTPFRQWQINSVLSVGVGWAALGAGGALYTLEAEDDSHVVPPISGEITEYNIPQPTAIAGTRTSDGVDLDRASLEQAGALDSIEGLVRFLTQALLPHGVAIMGGMNIGIGDMGISFHYAVLRAHAAGSTVRTVDLRDI